MALSQIEQSAVEAALAEYDELGRQAFLSKYGFGVATTYLLRHRGRFYDPKAIVGAANQYAPDGRPLKPNEFDATSAIARLERLGYEVVPFSGLWWVNQGATYKAERDGGYLWAPQQTKSGRSVAHHKDVNNLTVGQRIIHYADNRIRAVGTVAEAPYEAQRPAEFNTDAWGDLGYLCPVDYYELPTPIPRDDIRDRGPDVGPFTKDGNVKQVYLVPINHPHVCTMLEFLNSRIPDLFQSPITHPHASAAPSSMAEPSGPTDPILEALLAFKNVVLEGVPGTGKTYAIQRLAEMWRGRTGRELLSSDGRPYRAIVLHPSSSYEDFVEGLRPGVHKPDSSPRMFDQPVVVDGGFSIQDGFFLGVCAAAAAAPDRDVLVLLDELNRCNVPSVFGDLLLTLEASRRATFVGSGGTPSTAEHWRVDTPAQLTYSGRTFFVPDNVYVIATTNTTDRSVAPLDAALRRRFAFYRLEPTMPDGDSLPASVASPARDLFIQSAKVLRDLNDHALRPCLGPDAMLGQSYLYAVADALQQASSLEAAMRLLQLQWRYTILPQLIDTVRGLGADDLLDTNTRESWFAQHRELDQVRKTALPALSQLDSFLQQSLELQLVVDGTGLARGARIATFRVSASTPLPSDADTEDDDTEGSVEEYLGDVLDGLDDNA
ncbi:McrB family protein [Dactylosporangium sp. CA-092794]|uniref:McrB family protein n=1 Tax=Dactylosporangium sp. CA-092794 TaxID=3239929 RepID=UPI003D94444A